MFYESPTNKDDFKMGIINISRGLLTTFGTDVKYPVMLEFQVWKYKLADTDAEKFQYVMSSAISLQGIGSHGSSQLPALYRS